MYGLFAGIFWFMAAVCVVIALCAVEHYVLLLWRGVKALAIRLKTTAS